MVKKKLLLTIIGIVGIILFLNVSMPYGVMFLYATDKDENKDTDKYKITGKYLTDDHYRYSPIVYEDNVYFPSNYDESNYEYDQELGMLGHYEEALSDNTFYSSGGMLGSYYGDQIISLKTVDDFAMVYFRADWCNNISNIQTQLENFETICLCCDRDEGESRIVFEKVYLNRLIDDFSRVNTVARDYEIADDIIYIYGNQKEESIHGRTFDTSICYFGTILKYKDKYYYGNLENEIKDADVIGLINEL